MTYQQRLRAKRWREVNERIESRRPSLLDLLAGDDEERAVLNEKSIAELIVLSHCQPTLFEMEETP